ncbi:conjugative transfer protein MobI(A/C), partial [Klebsiella pneumoniae]
KNSLNRLIRCVCGKKIGPDPRNFNQRVSLGRNDLLIRTFLSCFKNALDWELEMILETENKIKPIRELLAEYHQRKLADIKRLEKLKRLI